MAHAAPRVELERTGRRIHHPRPGEHGVRIRLSRRGQLGAPGLRLDQCVRGEYALRVRPGARAPGRSERGRCAARDRLGGQEAHAPGSPGRPLAPVAAREGGKGEGGGCRVHQGLGRRDRRRVVVASAPCRAHYSTELRTRPQLTIKSLAVRRLGLFLFQNFKEQILLRKQIFSAIIQLYLFSQLSARIFPKRGCGGIPPPPNPLLPPHPSGQEFSRK